MWSAATSLEASCQQNKRVWACGIDAVCNAYLMCRCGASFGSTFLFENGASVDGAPVVSSFLRLPAPWLLLAILVSALPSPFAPRNLRLWCGSRSITLHPSLLSANHGVSCPTFSHLLSYLLTAPCTCKCKTFLIPNHSLSHEWPHSTRSHPLWSQDCLLTRHHARPISPLSAPSSYPPLWRTLKSPPSFSSLYHLPDIETAQMLKAISTMETRTRAVLSLSLSFPHMFTPPSSLLPLCLPITHVYSGESFVLDRGYRLTICQALSLISSLAYRGLSLKL